MRSSINFSNKAVVMSVAVLFLLAGCATVQTGPGPNGREAAEKPLVVAVMPVENLTGKPVPSDDIRQMMTDAAELQGFSVIDHAVLNAFLTNIAFDSSAGSTPPRHRPCERETGADAVLITTAELFPLRSCTIRGPQDRSFLPARLNGG